MTEAELRQHAADIVKSLAGSSANPTAPAARTKYLDFVAPAGSDRDALAARPNSALLATGLLRALGVALPDVLAPSEAVAGLISTSLAKAVDRLGLRVAKEKPLRFVLPSTAERFVAPPPAPPSAPPPPPAPPPAPPPPPPAPPPPPPAPPPSPIIRQPILDPGWLDRATIIKTHAPLNYAVAEDMRHLVDWAKQQGAWGDASTLPKPGDIVLASVPGAPARVMVVTSVSPDATLTFDSIDGGDRDDAGFPCLIARRHTVRDGFDIVVSPQGGGAPVEVTGVILLAKLVKTAEVAPAPPSIPQPTPVPQPDISPVGPPIEPGPGPTPIPVGPPIQPTPSVRDAAVDAARSVVGLGANPGDPTSRDRYGDLIAPGETPSMRDDMMSMSGCALTAAGILRLLGLTGPEIDPPYKIGSAVSRLVAFGRRAGAWVAYSSGKVPAPGDMVLVGGSAGGGPEHVFTIVGVTPGDPVRFESIDGGQRDPEGYQLVADKQRHWANDRDVVDSGQSLGEQRGVVGFLDVELLSAFVKGSPVGPPITPSSTGRWEDYSAGSGTPNAGQMLPAAITDAIAAKRSAIPRESGLTHVNALNGGYMYVGRTDRGHLGYLDTHLQALAADANANDARKILSFRALLPREGSTAAINTYDNMIVTWGVGFAGLGLLGDVMEILMGDTGVTAFFQDVGFRFAGDAYDVVDLDAGKVVSGMKPALQSMRASIDILLALIQAARDPATRDAVTGAQLAVFSAHSANHAGASEIATQALFNFITHLKHWAPAYATNAIPWAVVQAGGGSPSADRDRLLATQIGRYFYGRAHQYSWIPAFSQFMTYVKHMKDDGLDVTSDPWFTQSSPTDLPSF